MLTVYSVLWGDKYSPAYVYFLRDQVAEYLDIEHEFVCITKQKLPGIRTISPPVPYPGWWQKIGLFHPGIASGPSLYFDLDVVITGKINYLAKYTEQFSAPANWAQSGHGGIQSSVMAWPGNWDLPFRKFKDNCNDHMKRLWGDQEFLFEILGQEWQRLPGIGSYKYHVRPVGEIPVGMHVCVFHGKPDPHEVSEPCILRYTQTLITRINSGTANYSSGDLSATG